jgi:hypothetical protein
MRRQMSPRAVTCSPYTKQLRITLGGRRRPHYQLLRTAIRLHTAAIRLRIITIEVTVCLRTIIGVDKP